MKSRNRREKHFLTCPSLAGSDESSHSFGDGLPYLNTCVSPVLTRLRETHLAQVLVFVSLVAIASADYDLAKSRQSAAKIPEKIAKLTAPSNQPGVKESRALSSWRIFLSPSASETITEFWKFLACSGE
ncbi:hypothetical protein TNIN_429251 [Trichonephila inaurata madagascariensis]|uniref:Uncharacterized protein n=1 Tax=Trichonephila inaurata madagascariensis TaxID=2747483 RepID=A0A8X6IJD7_9ARAC|nr:hypothetical protein TNIN_429251 [Trichonephila inaurata madagascariensis]